MCIEKKGNDEFFLVKNKEIIRLYNTNKAKFCELLIEKPEPIKNFGFFTNEKNDANNIGFSTWTLCYINLYL